MLCDLARASRNNILMAGVAALCVVRRTKSIGHCFYFLEKETVVIERAKGNDIVLIDRAERWALNEESVAEVIEASRSLRRGRLVRRAFVLNCPVMAEALGTGVVTSLISAGLTSNDLCQSSESSQYHQAKK
jgi:hypothetical protein